MNLIYFACLFKAEMILVLEMPVCLHWLCRVTSSHVGDKSPLTYVTASLATVLTLSKIKHKNVNSKQTLNRLIHAYFKIQILTQGKSTLLLCAFQPEFQEYVIAQEQVTFMNSTKICFVFCFQQSSLEEIF